jgi:hypothetical protein
MIEITIDEDWFCLNVQNSLLCESDMQYSPYMKRDRFHLKRFVCAANECYNYTSKVSRVLLSGIISLDDVLRELHTIDAVVSVTCRTAIPNLVTDFSTLWLIYDDDAILLTRTTFCKCISMLVHFNCDLPLSKVILLLQ